MMQRLSSKLHCLLDRWWDARRQLGHRAPRVLLAGQHKGLTTAWGKLLGVPEDLSPSHTGPLAMVSVEAEKPEARPFIVYRNAPLSSRPQAELLKDCQLVARQSHPVQHVCSMARPHHREGILHIVHTRHGSCDVWHPSVL